MADGGQTRSCRPKVCNGRIIVRNWIVISRDKNLIAIFKLLCTCPVTLPTGLCHCCPVVVKGQSSLASLRGDRGERISQLQQGSPFCNFDGDGGGSVLEKRLGFPCYL
ncbi:hypothetical protein TIFTF001_030251 [Ficus carica]|uniref:Uncharacterized protein n=1 Tax=Ficus carica TaxID=3494 RepID=A0AA88IZC3_FICCA|nr:hypothetical protein TIFTF001_030251 [Ficus carica]